MGWREELQRASIGGVEFKVSGSGRTVGRRVAVQKFPGRKEAFVQDLGEDAATFTIDAYVIGPDYKVNRDRLEKKLLEPGPKTLIHPYRGTMTVSVIDPAPETSESKDQGGFATIRFTVIQSGLPDTLESPDTSQDLENSAKKSEEATNRRFSKVFSSDTYDSGKPTGRAIDKAVEVVTKINRNINSAIGLVDAATARISLLQTKLQTLIALPSEAAAAVGALVGTAIGGVRSVVVGTVDLVKDIVDGDFVRLITEPIMAQVETFGDDLEEATGGTEEDNQEAINQALIIRQTRTRFLTEWASLITILPFDSYNQAVETQERFVEALDTLLLDADDDEYQTLQDLSASLTAYLAQVASTLPEIGQYTPARTMPMLVIAHLLYGDASRDEEIILRNHIEHPGFTPPEELEILYS